MTIETTSTFVEESATTVVNTEWDLTVWGSDSQRVWAELRDQGPVFQSGPDVVAVTCPETVRQVLRDTATFSSNPRSNYFGSDTGAIPLQIDPPEHSHYRKLLDPMFSPKRMAMEEEAVTALANRLIDRFIERGSVDFSTEFAVPFPSEVFLHLMGLPFDELDEFLRVKEHLIRPPGNTEAERNQLKAAAGGWIFEYVNEAMEQRKASPTDDLLTYFSNLEADGRLTREQVVNICVLFIPAGLDTVTCTLECSIAFLAQHPEHQRQLVEDLTLVPAAVEELLRYESPVPQVTRVTMADTEIGGCPVAGGVRVRPMLAIVNHDPDVFPEPDRVDFHREGNPHIAFGGGIHRCVGSNLARLELRVALREIHRRIGDYRLAEGTELLYQPALREITHLPLEFTPGVAEGGVG